MLLWQFLFVWYSCLYFGANGYIFASEDFWFYSWISTAVPFMNPKLWWNEAISTFSQYNFIYYLIILAFQIKKIIS